MLTGTSWDTYLLPYVTPEYVQRVQQFLDEQYHDGDIAPKRENVFLAYQKTALNQVKVVILGQDPYPTPGNAQGLSFSVPRNYKLPASLRNIYQELHDDLNVIIPEEGDLTSWTEQGVLLLNTVLTVPVNHAGGHAGMIWEPLTDATIRLIAEQNQPSVFILWGKQAQKKEKLIQGLHNLVIKSAHPSPLSAYRGFFGSHPFSRANQFLEKEGVAPITWTSV